MDAMQVVWNDTVVGTLHDPKVDNFFLYGQFTRQCTAEVWQQLLDWLNNEGDVDVELRGGGKPLRASIIVEPEGDQLEVRLEPAD